MEKKNRRFIQSDWDIFVRFGSFCFNKKDLHMVTWPSLYLYQTIQTQPSSLLSSSPSFSIALFSLSSRHFPRPPSLLSCAICPLRSLRPFSSKSSPNLGGSGFSAEHSLQIVYRLLIGRSKFITNESDGSN